MKLTPRQQTFLDKLFELYRELQGPVHYSIVADKLGVNKFSAYDMLKVLAPNPEVSLRVIDVLNRELTAAHTLIRMLGQNTATEKVATFILSLVPADKIAPAELLLPMSRQEIAELLGLTIETVSRLMSELRREAVIDTPRGHIRIQNLARLRSLAGAPPTMPRQKGLNLAIQ